MVKILHIMPVDKFTADVRDFYAVFYKNHEILYLSYPGKEIEINGKTGLKQYQIIMRNSFDVHSFGRVLAMMKRYDYCILHSLFVPYLLQGWICADKRVLNKIVWIEWGFDLYVSQAANVFKKVLTRKIDIVIRTQIKAMIGIFPPDIDYYRSLYKSYKCELFFAPYCGPCIEDAYLNYSTYCSLEHKTKADVVYIQVGHNAIPTLNHEQVLIKLRRFANENIKIFLPLSYGDMVYGDYIEKKANALFGKEKCICLRKFIPKDQYFELQKKIDIAIFDTERQCALSNINSMIFKNVKLFMSETSTMFEYFRSKGIPIEPVSVIDDISYDKFRQPIKILNKSDFMKYINDYSSIDNRVSHWNKVYEFLDKGCKDE